VLSVLLAVAITLAPAEVLSRLPAPEAYQGVAVDGEFIYAIGNSEIGKYDRATGQRVGQWTGDPALVPHLNSCAVFGRELVCASSNYPATPMTSTIETFDADTLAHKRSTPLGRQPGSLTWIERRNGAWWAGFANYDGRGGEPGRDHRFTTMLRFDDRWRVTGAWTFPPSVLDRFKPRSNSGGAFGADGRLYVTGHDRPEVYVLDVPRTGNELRHVATIPVAFEGQAVAFDRARPGVLLGISRERREVVEMRLPTVEGP
jgi:outer membrane protein assembly factor BamB